LLKQALQRRVQISTRFVCVDANDAIPPQAKCWSFGYLNRLLVGTAHVGVAIKDYFVLNHARVEITPDKNRNIEGKFKLNITK
jgi:hypothetical protein